MHLPGANKSKRLFFIVFSSYDIITKCLTPSFFFVKNDFYSCSYRKDHCKIIHTHENRSGLCNSGIVVVGPVESWTLLTRVAPPQLLTQFYHHNHSGFITSQSVCLWLCQSIFKTCLLRYSNGIIMRCTFLQRCREYGHNGRLWSYWFWHWRRRDDNTSFIIPHASEVYSWKNLPYPMSFECVLVQWIECMMLSSVANDAWKHVLRKGGTLRVTFLGLTDWLTDW